MTYADAIAKRLLEICRERNITVNQLSTLSGISHTTIHDLVTGKSKNVKLKTLHKIVAFFGKKLYNELKRLRRGRIQCPEKEAKVSPTKK